MAEPHRESGRKGVASFKPGAEPVDSTDEIEQLVVTFNAAMGEIAKVEKVDKAGKRAHVIPLGDRRAMEVNPPFEKVTGIAATVAGVVFLSDKTAKTIEVFGMNGAKIGTFTCPSPRLDAMATGASRWAASNRPILSLSRTFDHETSRTSSSSSPSASAKPLSAATMSAAASHRGMKPIRSRVSLI